jgi:hypothetical protein
MVDQDERFNRIDAAIERFSQHVAARFDGIDRRLDAMDARFDGIDRRLDAMDARFDGMDARFDAMDVRFDGMDARFDAMDTRFDRLTQYVIELREESITRLDLMDGRGGLISSTLASIDPNSRLPALTKGVMDAGAISTKLALEISKQKTEFNARLAKLEETVAKLLPAA